MPQNAYDSPIVRFGLRFFCILLLVVAPVAAVAGYNNIRQAKDAVNWPRVQGTIRESRIEVIQTTKVTYEPRVEYGFEAKGRGWTGRLRAGGSSDRSKAQEVLYRYPLGSAVTVFHHPDDPNTSTIEPGVTWKDYFIFLIPPIMIGMAILCWRATRKPSHAGTAADDPTVESSTSLRI
jgi:hypothetical protein